MAGEEDVGLGELGARAGVMVLVAGLGIGSERRAPSATTSSP